MTKINNLFSSIRDVLTFAAPISAGLFVSMISSFVAMMMVARVGELQLAAGALAISTNITIITIVTTLFYAIGITIGHLRGQQKVSDEIGLVMKSGLWLAILFGIPGALLLWNVDHILTLFKQDKALIEIAKHYFHFASLTIFPTLINTVFGQFFTGINKPRYTMIISIIVLPIMILLSYIFVLGHFGFAQLGLAGISCSTMITQTIVAIGVFAYLKLNKHYAKYHIFSGKFLPNIAICKRIISLGFPIGIQFGAELGAMAVSTYFMGYFGVMALAASQVVSQYSMLVVMITIGLSQAISVLSSNAHGAKDEELVKQYIMAAITILSICFLGVFVMFLGFPNELIKIFVKDSATINSDMLHLTIQFFMISAITLYIDGIRNLFSGVLRGLHDSKTPMHIGVICLWGISLPMNYLVGFVLHGGPIGLRFGFMSGFVIAAFILWLRIRKKLFATNLVVSLETN